MDQATQQSLHIMEQQIQKHLETIRDEMQRRIAELQEQFRSESGSILLASAQALFDAYPELQSFGWWQGLRYNDEEDVLRVYNDDPDINGHIGGDLPYEEELKHLVPVQKAVSRFLTCIDDESWAHAVWPGAHDSGDPRQD